MDTPFFDNNIPTAVEKETECTHCKFQIRYVKYEFADKCTLSLEEMNIENLKLNKLLVFTCINCKKENKMDLSLLNY